METQTRFTIHSQKGTGQGRAWALVWPDTLLFLRTPGDSKDTRDEGGAGAILEHRVSQMILKSDVVVSLPGMRGASY